MAGMLETPSRIWRRIEAVEDREMPSLPSMPHFDDSVDDAGGSYTDSKDEEVLDGDISAPIHSTPTVALSNTTARNSRLISSTRSSARFANSIASRSSKSSLALSSSRSTIARKNGHESFDISVIPSLPALQPGNATGHVTDEMDSDLEGESRESVPDVYLPPADDYDNEDEDVSLTEALRSVSRAGSPPLAEDSYDQGATPKRSFNYSASLRSEPKPSPLDKYRNVALRKTTRPPGNRTPSLTRTSSSDSPGSSPTHSTPHSTRSFRIAPSNAASPIPAANIPLPRSLNPSPAVNTSRVAAASPLPGLSIPLPRSRTASPAVYIHESQDAQSERSESEPSVSEQGMRSMDITDVHISPQVVAEVASRPREYSQTTEEGQSTNDREPTFSSEGSPDAAPYAPAARHSPETQFSSPATSVAFTPTPAFPRPRARFGLPPPPTDLLATPTVHEDEEDEEDGDDIQETPRPPSEELLTPHTRRRSFFLAVINSTARPRLKAPTPHPRRGDIFATPSIAESTPSSGSSTSSAGPSSALPPRANLQTAFAGVTPRPRLRGGPRPSHPLAQTIIPSQSYSDTESPSPAQVPSVPSSGEKRVAWATPAPASHSPYDGAGDRASFISTASSHDLTTHQRANTSFDPAMGFGMGAPGQGVGRFNATKLNNYLHGLNRRLQEENEVLVARIRALEENDNEDEQAQGASESRRSSLDALSSRRVSLGSTPLGDVAEDVSGEGWVEEKAALEEMVQSCRDELAMCVAEKEELQRALEEEKGGREEDRERWKDRMTEVMGPIIKELKTKVEIAENKAKVVELDCEDQLREMENKLNELQTDLELTTTRAEKAESAWRVS
ncbi:hypothetical protein BDN72DRAFT_459007 [Pluteus cervinus]|uniref:Uncharacterized protein n=1 Tax=Pluteus cervinus TaxID=181527 RepID=A0ACD3B1I0_9AGAR|nr:hypothetical protein BDN72DRAFT_459007 [Pluteus cervinus]